MLQPAELASKIDHTILKPEALLPDVQKIVAEAIESPAGLDQHPGHDLGRHAGPRPGRVAKSLCPSQEAHDIGAEENIVGIMMASFMNNGGGAWDNAKKMIEDGQLKDEKGNVIGKKTFAHAAAVVGDTLGDPLKDTAGPSLHVLIKLLATITLVMVPLFIK